MTESDYLLILYGSESGTAQDVAERIWREAKQYKMQSNIYEFDNYNIVNLPNESLAIFIVSTTGQGDPPLNMKKSWRFLLRKSLSNDSLVNTRIAVLGLGDSSYVKYNFIGKKLYKRLLQLGAQSVLPLGLADDQHDLGSDGVILPWIRNFWDSIGVKKGILNTNEELILRWNVEEVYNKNVVKSLEIPFGEPNQRIFMKIKENLRTTPIDHFQEVRLIKLQCDFNNISSNQSNPLDYDPGDIALVMPQNSQKSVEKFLHLFNSKDRPPEKRLYAETILKLTQIHTDMQIPEYLIKPFTLKDCAQNYWDLNVVPRRYVFEILAYLTTNELEKEKLIELSSSSGQEELYNYCNRPRRTIVEVLADFPYATNNLTLPYLFDLMQPIKPRAFSIASSPLVEPGEIHLLIAVVKYKTNLVEPRYGFCSNWLKTLPIGQRLLVAVKSGSLRFSKEDIPLIMVGPGTGVAPFRSYILTEFFRKTNRKMLLFFGCRNQFADFHFENEWNKIENNNFQLILAFSRDQPHKIYVQHKIIEYGELVSNIILKENGNFVVAGNAKDMPQAVWESLAKSLVQYGQLSHDDAKQFLSKMEITGKYQTETWS